MRTEKEIRQRKMAVERVRRWKKRQEEEERAFVRTLDLPWREGNTRMRGERFTLPVVKETAATRTLPDKDDGTTVTYRGGGFYGGKRK